MIASIYRAKCSNNTKYSIDKVMPARACLESNYIKKFYQGSVIGAGPMLLT